MLESSGKGRSGSTYVSSLSQLADEATKASISMFNCVIQELALSMCFKYIGVRYWLYIVCASLFLLKVRISHIELNAQRHGMTLMPI